MKNHDFMQKKTYFFQFKGGRAPGAPPPPPGSAPVYFCWRTNYKEELGLDTIYRFNPVTFLCISQSRILIGISCCALFVFHDFHCLEVVVRFIEIGGIVEHHCVNY